MNAALPQEPECSSNLTRDNLFYMSLATFQVEDCLFRVPRQILEAQSEIFRDMFSLSAVSDAEPEGLSDNNPIRLDGINKAEFKRFLEVLFMIPYNTTSLDPPEPSRIDEWLPVVKLAHMWGCDTLCQYAIERMPYSQYSKPAVEKVAIALQYNIKPWLFPGLEELARRKEPIGVQDVNILGLDTALKVAAVRESPASWIRTSANFNSAIQEFFEVSASGPGPMVASDQPSAKKGKVKRYHEWGGAA